MMTAQILESICLEVSMGKTLDLALAQHNITPRAFWTFVTKNPEAKSMFEASRVMALEGIIDSLISGIDSAIDKFDLDKANARARVTQWLAEKLIPSTYGQKLEVQQNVTIDVVEVLRLARERRKVVSVDSQVVSQLEVKDEDLLS